MLRNFQVHKSIDMALNTYHNKDKGIKIYPVSEKNKYLSWLLFRDQLSWILIAVKILGCHLDTKDQEPVNQFGHLSKQEREWTQAGAQFEGCGEGRVTQTTRMSEWETRRDQLAADANQQLTRSQFRGPGANKVIACEY